MKQKGAGSQCVRRTNIGSLFFRERFLSLRKEQFARVALFAYANRVLGLVVFPGPISLRVGDLLTFDAKVLNGYFYQIPVGHEALVGRFDQSPVPCQQSYSHAFLHCWPKGIAIGSHIVSDNLLVVDSV